MDYSKKFNRLRESGNAMFVTSPKLFNPTQNIDKYAETSIKWAYDNAYNGHFRGSTNKFKTMLDAFMGKMGEFATYDFFKSLNYELDLPETILRQKGEWDDGDLIVGEQKVQIKTTIHTSNFLLLKKRDWDAEGNYNWGKDGKDPKYGAFFLCRLKPDPKQIFTESPLEELISQAQNISWKCEVTGFLSKKDVIYAIANNYIVERGKYLNGKFQVKDDLIYFQSGDLRDPELIPRKKI